MSRDSNTHTVSITAASGLPYTVPTISGTLLDLTVADGNFLDSSPACRPAAITSGNWQYSLLGSYGGGTFVDDYSTAGAYVIASTGGHNAPENLDAAVFDFSTGLWSRINNANGLASNSSPIPSGNVNNQTDGEIVSPVPTSPEIPAPCHGYLLPIAIPTSWGGGPKGSYLLTVGPACTVTQFTRQRSHKMSLATGLWTRASSTLINTDWANGSQVYGTSAIDLTTGRVYTLPLGAHAYTFMRYLDLGDNTYKNTASYSFPSGDLNISSIFIYEAGRLLMMLTAAGQLRAWNLNNFAAGLYVVPFTGTNPHNDSSTQTRWVYCPDDGSFYTYLGSGSVIQKLTPPGSNPLTNSWTFSTRTITPAPTTQYLQGGGAFHNTRFFYVPAAQCFAWIPLPAAKVQLIKP